MAATERWSRAPEGYKWRIVRHAFTDGSTYFNASPLARSGYSAALQPREEYDMPGDWYDQNGYLPGKIQENNRAELFAVLVMILEADFNLCIHSDSKYTIMGLQLLQRGQKHG